MSIAVLFVCHANVCRSPLAHGILVHQLEQRGLGDAVRVDSAGTWAADGLSPHRLSVEVARDHGVSLEPAGASRSVGPDDLETFDHILAMDRRNLADLERFRRLSAFGAVDGEQAQIRLVQHVLDPSLTGADADIHDPVRSGKDAFEAVYTRLEEACARLLVELDLVGRR